MMSLGCTFCDPTGIKQNEKDFFVYTSVTSRRENALFENIFKGQILCNIFLLCFTILSLDCKCEQLLMGSKSAYKQTIKTSFKLILNSALNVENMLLMSDDPSSRLPQTAALLHGR